MDNQNTNEEEAMPSVISFIILPSGDVQYVTNVDGLSFDAAIGYVELGKQKLIAAYYAGVNENIRREEEKKPKIHLLP